MKKPPERVFLEKKGKNKENLPLSYPKSPFGVGTFRYKSVIIYLKDEATARVHTDEDKICYC